jgi:aminodeoxyfutalosine deaminase
MRLFSAQYVFTNSGQPLRRPIIATGDDGTIISVTDTAGNLKEIATLEFYNGIIVPGFINCHCHLELSHFRGLVEPESGLPRFIGSVRKLRDSGPGGAEDAAIRYDTIMASEGIVACADICNSTDSFKAKSLSSVNYLSLIEVFGINPDAASHRFSDALALASEAEKKSLPHNIVPHSAYSVSTPLLQLIKDYKGGTGITSLHFMESESEALLLSGAGGPMLEAYREFGIDLSSMRLPSSHADAVMNLITTEGNLILVHNTFAGNAEIDTVNGRGRTFWCLCVNSNLYISRALPPVTLLRSKGCKIVLGTDSLASNPRLSILSEMITLQERFPETETAEIVRWATLNGAEALGIDATAGSIEPGKRPGLLLIEKCDLLNLRLTHESSVKRLI